MDTQTRNYNIIIRDGNCDGFLDGFKAEIVKYHDHILINALILDEQIISYILKKAAAMEPNKNHCHITKKEMENLKYILTIILIYNTQINNNL